MLPREFKKNYLTQQMAMKIGRQIDKNDFYFDDIEKKVRRLLIDPIEKDSGRGFPDILDLVDSLDLTDFLPKCRKFAR